MKVPQAWIGCFILSFCLFGVVEGWITDRRAMGVKFTEDLDHQNTLMTDRYNDLTKASQACIQQAYKDGWLGGYDLGYWNSAVDTIYGENLFSIDTTDPKVLKISKRVETLPKNFKGALK